MIRVAEYFSRHGHALRQILGAPAAPNPRRETTPRAAGKVHCTECDAVLSPETHLRCRTCRELLCPTDLCKASHAARHKAASVPAPDPEPEVVRPYIEPPLPAGAVDRCAVCRRPLSKYQYLRCGICNGITCKRGECHSLHFACHHVAARKATLAHAHTQLDLSLEAKR